MLRKFEYESPNVVDPGDSAPGRPSRPPRKVDDDHNNIAPPGSFGADDIRARASYLLEQEPGYKPNPKSFLKGRKIIYNPRITNPQDDDGFHPSSNTEDEEMPAVDDVELPVHDQLPSVEQARMFAATILNETEKHDSRRNILSSSSPPNSPKSSEYDEMASLTSFMRGRRGRKTNHDDYGFDNGRRLRRKQTCYRLLCITCIAAVLTVIASTVVLLVYGRVSRSNQSPTTIADDNGGSSDRMDAIVSLLSENNISDAGSLTRSDTPQYKAAYWLANHDKLRLDIPERNIISHGNAHLLQRYVLAVLYYSLDGDNWTHNLKFLDEHECAWFSTISDETDENYAMGVDCNKHPETLQVNSILIPNNNAKGSIPNELGYLSKLELISLKLNDISGTIPDSLRSLPRLDYLDLSYNNFSGSLPDFLGDFINLKVLGLSHNGFEGSLRTEMSSLTNLLTLAVDNNVLTGDLEPVASMTNLEYFYGENNGFNSRLDKGILDNLQNLINLDLSGNSLKSTLIPPGLFEMTGLKAIDLSNNKIKGSIPDNFKTNNVLEFISLRLNQVTGELHSNFGTKLKALTHLDLEDNQLTGLITDHLFTNFTGLTHLFLGKNAFDEWSMPDSMARMTSLRELSLDECNLVGKFPSFFPSDAFKHLKVLDLRQNGLTGSLPNSENENWDSLQKLSVLLLNDNELTGSLPDSLTSLQNLEVVSLHHNGFLADAGGLCRTDGDSLGLLTADCGGTFTCDCCEDTCCDSEDCYSDIEWDSLEFSETRWEQHFHHDGYSFNPHILTA